MAIHFPTLDALSNIKVRFFLEYSRQDFYFSAKKGLKHEKKLFYR
jgi:hypothetical protein